MIFSLTSCFVVPQKDFRFFTPCSSEYQTTPFQRPSVRLKMFPFVSNFRCIVQRSFLSNTIYHRKKARGCSHSYQKSNNLTAWSEALSLFQRIIFASGSSRWSRSRPWLSDREVGVGFRPQKSVWLPLAASQTLCLPTEMLALRFSHQTSAAIFIFSSAVQRLGSGQRKSLRGKGQRRFRIIS